MIRTWIQTERAAVSTDGERRAISQKTTLVLVGGSRWIADIQRLAGVAKHWFLANIAD